MQFSLILYTTLKEEKNQNKTEILNICIYFEVRAKVPSSDVNLTEWLLFFPVTLNMEKKVLKERVVKIKTMFGT